MTFLVLVIYILLQENCHEVVRHSTSVHITAYLPL